MNSLRQYFFSIVLLCSVLAGGLFGYFFGAYTPYIKWLGELFLNLIFTTMVPLIFFSVASALSKNNGQGSLSRLFSSMFLVFLVTSLTAAILSLLLVKLFPLTQSVELLKASPLTHSSINWGQKTVELFTVPSFGQLFSHEHMLALLVFSALVGAGASNLPNGSRMLKTGETLFMNVFSYVMYLAPIGFFAYFSSLVYELGPKIIQQYMQVSVLYYGFGLFYFVVVYSLWAYLAGGNQGIKTFWQNIGLPATTALATCSSAASIPANYQACSQMNVASKIYETTIPLGTLIHKDGSIIGGMIKIAFLFSVFHMDFSGLQIYCWAMLTSMLVGSVMGAIPSGGMLGELLILTVYGFPSNALIAIAAISIIIDPLATMLNVTGNSICAMLMARLLQGKKWLQQ